VFLVSLYYRYANTTPPVEIETIVVGLSEGRKDHLEKRIFMTSAYKAFCQKSLNDIFEFFCVDYRIEEHFNDGPLKDHQSRRDGTSSNFPKCAHKEEKFHDKTGRPWQMSLSCGLSFPGGVAVPDRRLQFLRGRPAADHDLCPKTPFKQPRRQQ
jgi:hypothetical protein